MSEKKESLGNRILRSPAVAWGGGIYLGAAFVIPQFLPPPYDVKEVVTIQGAAFNERYIDASVREGYKGTDTPSKYFFFLNKPKEGRVKIRVLSTRDVSKETIDDRVNQGTRVEVKARKTGPQEYTAFANEVYVPPKHLNWRNKRP